MKKKTAAEILTDHCIAEVRRSGRERGEGEHAKPILAAMQEFTAQEVKDELADYKERLKAEVAARFHSSRYGYTVSEVKHIIDTVE